MDLQIVIDNKNTELLIDIIKKRGYPNKKNTSCEKFPGTIFVHSQSQYFEEIRTLIEDEYKQKRIEYPEYVFFLHHINGRTNKELEDAGFLKKVDSKN